MNAKNHISREPEGFALSLNTTIYSLEAIKKTAYKFADRTSIVIRPNNDATVSVVFAFVGNHAKSDPEQVLSEFCNELLDQDLREVIKRETAPLRAVIMAHAFSRSSLAEED